MVATVQDSTPRDATPKFLRRRDEIIRLAIGVLNRKGVRGMTLGEIAAQLGLVPTAVSYYFRRKEDLAAECYQLAIERYNDFADAAASAGPSGEDRLRAYFHAYAELFRAMYDGRADPIAAFNDIRTINDPAVNSSYVDMFRRARRVVSPDGGIGLERHERNARTHLVISQAYWAALWLQRYDRRDFARMTERMCDILINGLSAGAATAPVQILGLGVAGESGSETKAAFLRAATQLINEKGYLGASVQKIADVLNVTKGAFYYHNQAKDDLVAQCFDATLDRMRAAQEAADASTRTGLENVLTVASSLVYNEVSGTAPLLRTSALTAVPEGIRDQVILRIAQVSARLASVISDGIADGSIRPVDASVAAHMVAAMINAGAELHHWAPGLDPGEAVQAYVRPLFDGVFSPGRSSRPQIA